jgi:hypothetical protein
LKPPVEGGAVYYLNELGTGQDCLLGMVEAVTLTEELYSFSKHW